MRFDYICKHAIYDSTAPSTKQGEAKETISSATDITLNEIQTLTRNQKVNVQGHLTLGQNRNKEVIKRHGEKGIRNRRLCD